MALAVGVAVAVWFVDRARIGVRARRVCGVRLRVIDRAVSAVGPALARSGIAGALVGAWFGGWPGIPIGIAAGWLWWLASQRRARRRELARLDEQVPEAMRALAAGLRAGGNLQTALTASGQELAAPMGPHLLHLAARLSVGMRLEAAVERFAQETATATCARLAETLRIGAVAGASLPHILVTAATTQDEWARLERDSAAASAQVRLSALVVGAMPLAFLTLAGPSARGPARILLREPAGWMLLSLGLGLDALGWKWMHRAARVGR